MNCSANSASIIYIWCLTLLIFGFCFCRGFSNKVLCIASEREALLKFKHHLKDPSGRLISWIPHTDCCKWDGIVCSNVTGHVLELHLRSSAPPLDVWWSSYDAPYEAYERSRFGGHIDPSLLDLKHLSYLDLSGNNFSGMNIPTFIGSLTNLTYLNLSGAGFVGKIPYQIGNLFNLLYLDLKNNYYYHYTTHGFSGEVPHQIGNLTKLIHLDLGNTPYDYFDELPIEDLQWLSSLTSLQYIDMTSMNLLKASNWLEIINKFSNLKELHLLGCPLQNHNHLSNINFSSLVVLDLSYSIGYPFIPNWVFELHNLESLMLRDNEFEGPISRNIQNLTLLENLDLSSNLFNSSIPNELYGCHHLKFLNLGFNNFHGTISNAIGNLSSLVLLDLSYNGLEGNLPNSLGNLTSLVILDLSFNQLGGNLPISLGNFNYLVILDVSDNHLEGNLSTSLGNLSSIVILDISGNQLEGNLPVSFGTLISLKYLYLDDNQFTGNPFEIIGKLSQLESFDIVNNHFQGAVNEAHLIGLTSLKLLFGSDNQLTLEVSTNWNPCFQLTVLYMDSWNLGPNFPTWILSQKNLTTLSMSNTRISDSIPTWLWSSFSNAVFINISHNHIYGELPNTLMNSARGLVDLSSNNLSGQLSYISLHLYHLDLSNNSLSGSITNFLCSRQDGQKSIEFLNLAFNNLSGHIPDCWIMYQNLLTVKLENNFFIGRIPKSLGFLPLLKYLQLRNNMLSGNFPVFLKNSSNLICLDLGENEISGGIPTEITSLSQLLSLNLSANHLTGPIPETIGNMGSLLSLDFSRNQLSGEIPQSIKELSFLEELDVSYNNLTGKIPTGTQLQSFDASSFIGNDLCGPPLPINWGSPETFPNTDEKGKKGNGIKINWFFVTMPFGFIVGFWGFVGPLFFIRSWGHTYYGWLDRMWCKIRYCWW